MNNGDYKYKALMERLKEDILQHRLSYGEKIPSENELAKSFSISRFTVRRAIELLTNEGWLERRQGSGTFVSSSIARRTVNRLMEKLFASSFSDGIFSP